MKYKNPRALVHTCDCGRIAQFRIGGDFECARCRELEKAYGRQRMNPMRRQHKERVYRPSIVEPYHVML